jgi:hypothetical protein
VSEHIQQQHTYKCGSCEGPLNICGGVVEFGGHVLGNFLRKLVLKSFFVFSALLINAFTYKLKKVAVDSFSVHIHRRDVNRLSHCSLKMRL